MSSIGSIDYDALASALVRINAVPSGGVVGERVGVNVQKNPIEGGSQLAVGAAQCGVGSVASEGSDAVRGGVEVVAVENDDRSETSNESLSGGQPGVVSDLVRNSTVFGAVVGASGGDVAKQEKSSYYASVVRGAHAVAMAEKLLEFGFKVPKRAMGELAICTFAAGCMPDVVIEGKRKLRGLACLGDAALTLHLIVNMYVEGKNVENMQQVRSKFTSDKHLGMVMQRTGLLEFVAFPPGVDPVTSKSGATAFEAIIGVAALYANPKIVSAMLSKMQVV